MADAQGTRHFGSDDVQLWQMITNVASAAYVYGEPTVSVWGRVFTTCDKQSTVTVAAAGYAVAYLYLQGGIVTRGTTTVLEASVQQSGCSGIANVLDGKCMRHCIQRVWQCPNTYHSLCMLYVPAYVALTA